MPVVTTKQMLLDAQQHGYAVPAFNIENMEMMQAAVDAAIAQQSPVILQTSASTLKYAPPALYYNMAEALAKDICVPVAMHLDHGNSFALCAQTLRAGYTSIMIDGSTLPFEENAALTKNIVELASPAGVPVEAELGMVGGKEGDLVVSDDDARYTDPDKAALFAEKTGVGSLAVAIGTVHGHYKGEPMLDFVRLQAIWRKVAVPLVLHGASGVADDMIAKCVANGICKVNYATELREAYTKAVREILAGSKAYDPKAYGRVARQCVQAIIEHKMMVCGSAGRVAV